MSAVYNAYEYLKDAGVLIAGTALGTAGGYAVTVGIQALALFSQDVQLSDIYQINCPHVFTMAAGALGGMIKAAQLNESRMRKRRMRLFNNELERMLREPNDVRK